MGVFARAKSLLQVFRRKGFLHGLKSAAERARTRFNEWRLGIDTEAVIYPAELGIRNPECNEYSPTSYALFMQMLRWAEIDAREHVFFDFGAGMGRAMIMAATQPFRAVYGVELSEELVAIAEKNIERSRPRLRCADVRIALGDATCCEIPSDASLFYFFNPFFGEVLNKVLWNIKESLVKSPRRAMFVCNIPEHSNFELEIRKHVWLRVEKDIVHEGQRCLVLSTGA